MDWFKVSSKLYADPDVQRLSDKAFRYWMNALAWCADFESDGLFQFAGKPPRYVQELVDAGRFEPTDDPRAYVVAGWSKWQETKESLKRKRDAANERKERWRNAEGTRSERSGNASGSKSKSPSISSSEVGLEGSRLQVVPEARFDEFWRAYPRHEGVAAARRAFAKAVSRASAEDIILGAERYRDDPNRDPGFTAHGATWLNQDRWLDDPLPPRGKRNDSVRRILSMAEQVEEEKP